MADVRPFPCLRPAKETVSRVAALPYDVYNRKEAREVVKEEPISFLAIDRPETQFPPETDMYSQPVYDKAAEVGVSPVSVMNAAGLEGELLRAQSENALTLSPKDQLAQGWQDFSDAVRREYEASGKVWYR